MWGSRVQGPHHGTVVRITRCRSRIQQATKEEVWGWSWRFWAPRCLPSVTGVTYLWMAGLTAWPAGVFRVTVSCRWPEGAGREGGRAAGGVGAGSSEGQG